MTESQNEKDAGEVTGRTPWDIVSYVLNSFKENTSIFILFAVLVAAIYVLDDRYQKVQKQTDDRIANEQMQSQKRLSDAGALLNQTYKTMSEINTSQVLGIKELFEVTRKANADAADARRDVADAQKERDRIQKLLDGEKKTLADTMIVLSQKSERLDNVKGRIVELTKFVLDGDLQKAGAKLDELIREMGWPNLPINSNVISNLRAAEKPPTSAPSATPAPIPPPSDKLRSLDPEREPVAVNSIERNLSKTEIVQIQRALCVDDLTGEFDKRDSKNRLRPSPTRSALRRFFFGYDYDLNLNTPEPPQPRGGSVLSPRPPIKVSIPDDPAASSIDTSEKLVAILTAIKKYGSCDNDGPRDAFEVGLFIHQGEDGIRNALSKAASFSKISSKIPDQKKWSAADVRRIAKELRDKYRLNEGIEGNATALFDFNFLEALNELFQGRQSSKQESSFVASVQKALCMRFTNGAVGDLTREAIENYLRGMQKPVPKTIDPDSAALKPMLQAAIDDVGDCTKSGFADAYEVGWLGVPASQSTNRIRNLQETINQFLKMKNSPVSVVATGKLDQQTRKAIDEFQELTGSSGEGSERMRELVLALP